MSKFFVPVVKYVGVKAETADEAKSIVEQFEGEVGLDESPESILPDSFIRVGWSTTEPVNIDGDEAVEKDLKSIMATSYEFPYLTKDDVEAMSAEIAAL